MLEQHAVEGNFSNKIFTLIGYVNRKNCRIRGPENPQLIEERPLHLEKVTAWCTLWFEGLIGPFFFETLIWSVMVI